MMTLLLRHVALAALFIGCEIAALNGAPSVNISPGIDFAPWDALLKKYVDARGLVSYAAWRGNPADLVALDELIGKFAAIPREPARGAEEIATIINAYNALTIRWILQNYPTESIRDLDGSWSKARWTIGGRLVSLDEIEHKNLRPLYGWRVHGTIVCAARSCPPLQNEAYTAGNLTALTDRAFRAWLGRDDLNRFNAAAGTIEISAIFKWFKDDFSGSGELSRVLAEFAPARFSEFVRRGQYKVAYLDYHWGLNDSGGRGARYQPGLWQRIF